MANEFRHGDVGTSLSEAEYDSLTGHSFASQATGDVMYASSATQLTRLGIGTTAYALTVVGGIPAWALLTVAGGGTGAATLTDGGVLLGSGTGPITAMGVLQDNELIVGDGTTDPVAESGATLRTSIGVAIGSDVLAYDAGIQQIADLADPDADRGIFWDDSASAYVFFTFGSGLTMTDTTLAAAGGPSQANQAALEAETNEDTYLAPDLAHFGPWAAKAWAKVDGAGTTVDASYNITDTTDNNVGDLTVNIATDFSSADWAQMVLVNQAADTHHTFVSFTQLAGTFGAKSDETHAGTSVDPQDYWFAGFGDHA